MTNNPTQVEPEGLADELERALPLLDGLTTGQDCQDYAFAKADGFQAMTYCPQAFEALRCIPRVIAALRSSTVNDELVEALEKARVRFEAIGSSNGTRAYIQSRARVGADHARAALAKIGGESNGR